MSRLHYRCWSRIESLVFVRISYPSLHRTEESITLQVLIRNKITGIRVGVLFLATLYWRVDYITGDEDEYNHWYSCGCFIPCYIVLTSRLHYRCWGWIKSLVFVRVSYSLLHRTDESITLQVLRMNKIIGIRAGVFFLATPFWRVNYITGVEDE